MDPFEYKDIAPGAREVPRPLSRWKRILRRFIVITLGLVLFGTVPATVLVGIWVNVAWGITVLVIGALATLLLSAVGAVIDGTLKL